MDYAELDFHITDEKSGGPLADVVVKVLDRDGIQTYVLNTTNADGMACFLLPASASYQVRFYKFGVRFENPQIVDVHPCSNHWMAPRNHYKVVGKIPEKIEATDARLCCASGYFRNVDGSPRSNLALTFTAQFNPFVLEGAGVTEESVTVRTNADGFVSVNLIRHAKYDVRSVAWSSFRQVTVPDSASTNLPEMLFPRVHRVVCKDPGPIRASVKEEKKVSLQVFLSDGRQLLSIARDIAWATEDDRIACVVEKHTDHIVVRGMSRGETRLVAHRVRMQDGSSPVYYPNTPIYGVPITIQVL